jgi:tRNA(Arg) A34 adenosine deaminase TadA
MPTDDDERLLRRAIELSAEALASGNPPFGSLLAGPDGAVLAEERNTALTDADITAHPELKLARWAAASLDRATAADTTMYTSCQPCGMCTGAIERSGLGKVVYAMSNEELATIKPASAGPFPVPQKHADGLLAEAGVPVRAFYAAP